MTGCTVVKNMVGRLAMNMTANAIRYAMITPLPAIPIAAPVFVMMPAPMVEPIAMKKRSFPLSFLILVLSFFVFRNRCFLSLLSNELRF